MKQNLDTLKDEILKTLEAEDFAVFQAVARVYESVPRVFWNTTLNPDYKDFLEVARKSGARVVVFCRREFSEDQLEEVLDSLEDSDLPGEEQQSVRRRLKALKNYTGFTCVIELSFDCQGSCYIFELRSEWYDEFLEIADEVDLLSGPEPYDEGDEDGRSMDFFSRN